LEHKERRRKMGRFTDLLNQATTIFLADLDGQRGELLAMDDPDAASLAYGLVSTAIDEVLDERSDTYIQTLLLCCLDDATFFTQEPDSVSCVTENGSPGQENAAHWVYHNVYDALRAALEREYDEWHASQQEGVQPHG
jgi:hypothetical protein